MEQIPDRIVMVSSPGMGLFIPMIEFAQQLVHLHGFHVTCIIPNVTGSITDTMKSILPPSIININPVFLPPVNLRHIPEAEGACSATLISLSITASLAHIRKVLLGLGKTKTAGCRLVGLFADMFSIPAFDVAQELNIPPYLFFPSGAIDLSFFLHFPELDKMYPPSCHLKDVTEPVQLLGCSLLIPGCDLEKAVLDRSTQSYKFFLENSKRFLSAKAIAVNTFFELQPATLKVLQQQVSGYPPIYPIGPLVRNPNSCCPSSGSVDDDDLCLRWLDEQPRGSVLLVSFGSGGTLSQLQTNELAWGLEMSGVKFLWVVKSPNDESTNAAYLDDDHHKHKYPSSSSSDHRHFFLPNGFVDRTKGRGLLVFSWAPQPQILRHVSIGGFLTHCGWNSILESIVNGVPLIAWPLFAEQKMNALLLTQELKVALRPKPNEEEHGLIERLEVAKVARALMEGEEGKRIGERMELLKEAASKAALGGEAAGSSTNSMLELALKLKNA